MRFFPNRRRLRDLVRQGYLGQLRYVLQTVVVDYGVIPGMEPYWYTWVARKEQGGGFLTGMLSHEIDLLRYTLGDLHEVSGSLTIAAVDKPVLAWEYRDGDAIGADSPTVGTEKATADDVAVVAGRLDNGAPFVLTGTWAVRHGSGNQLEIHGSEGSAVVAGNVLKTARWGEDLAEAELPPQYALDVAAGERMVPASARLFEDLAAVVDGRRSLDEALFARLEDGLRTQQVMEAVRRDGERIIGAS
jgi:predicted dehydrogenase